MDAIPFEYLCKIADHCPRAMSTYLICHSIAHEHDLVISDENIRFFGHSRTIIKNDLQALAREGFLEYWVNGELISVTLAGYDE